MAENTDMKVENMLIEIELAVKSDAAELGMFFQETDVPATSMEVRLQSN